jgi:hypothetical protein
MASTSNRDSGLPLGGDDESRREFLKKSAKAVYAAPVLITLAVAKESAAGSPLGPSSQEPPPPPPEK